MKFPLINLLIKINFNFDWWNILSWKDLVEMFKVLNLFTGCLRDPNFRRVS